MSFNTAPAVMSNEEYGRKALKLFVLIILSIPVMSIAHAFVVMTLWRWYIVPLGLQTISMAHAYGISLFVGFIATSLPPKTPEASKEEKLNRARYALMQVVMKPILALTIGWIALQFM